MTVAMISQVSAEDKDDDSLDVEPSNPDLDEPLANPEILRLSLARHARSSAFNLQNPFGRIINGKLCDPTRKFEEVLRSRLLFEWSNVVNSSDVSTLPQDEKVKEEIERRVMEVQQGAPKKYSTIRKKMSDYDRRILEKREDEAIQALSWNYYEPPNNRRLLLKDLSHGRADSPIPVYCDVAESTEALPEFPQIDFLDKNELKLGDKYIRCQFTYSCGCQGECEAGKCDCIKTNKDMNKKAGPILKDGRLCIKDPTTDVYTYALYTCGDLCGCPSSCPNRIEKFLNSSRLEVYRSDPNVGFRIRTLTSLAFGEIVAEFTGEVKREKSGVSEDYALDLGFSIEVDLAQKLELLLTKYHDKTLVTEFRQRLFIDPFKKGNATRFISHGCFPNLQLIRVFSNYAGTEKHRLVFFATRPILAGTELTFNYGVDYVARARFACRCGTLLCRNNVDSWKCISGDLRLLSLNKIVQKMDEKSKELVKVNDDHLERVFYEARRRGFKGFGASNKLAIKQKPEAEDEADPISENFGDDHKEDLTDSHYKHRQKFKRGRRSAAPSPSPESKRGRSLSTNEDFADGDNDVVEIRALKEEAESDDGHIEEEAIMPLMEKDSVVGQTGEHNSESLEGAADDAEMHIYGNCEQDGLRSPESEDSPRIVKTTSRVEVELIEQPALTDERNRSSIVDEIFAEAHNDVIQNSAVGDLSLVVNRQNHCVAREDFSQQVRAEELQRAVWKEIKQEDLCSDQLDLDILSGDGQNELMEEALSIEELEENDETMALVEEETVIGQPRGRYSESLEGAAEDAPINAIGNDDQDGLRGPEFKDSTRFVKVARREEEALEELTDHAAGENGEEQTEAIPMDIPMPLLEEELNVFGRDTDLSPRTRRDTQSRDSGPEQHSIQDKEAVSTTSIASEGQRGEEGGRRKDLSENYGEIYSDSVETEDDSRIGDQSHEDKGLESDENERLEREPANEVSRDSEEAHDDNRRHVILGRSHHDQGLNEHFEYQQEEGERRERRLQNDGRFHNDEEEERRVDGRYRSGSSEDVGRDRRRERVREEQLHGDFLHHRYETNWRLNLGSDVRHEENRIHRRDVRQDSRYEVFAREGSNNNYEYDKRPFSHSRNDGRQDDHYSRRNYDRQATEPFRRGEISYRHLEERERRLDGGRERYGERRHEGFSRPSHCLRGETEYTEGSSHSRNQDERRRRDHYNESRNHNGTGRNFQQGGYDAYTQGGQVDINCHDIFGMGRFDQQPEKRDRHNDDRQDQSNRRKFEDRGDSWEGNSNERRFDSAVYRNEGRRHDHGGLGRQEYERDRYADFRSGKHFSWRRETQGESESRGYFERERLRRQREEGSRVDANARRDIFDSGRMTSGQRGNLHQIASDQPSPSVGDLRQEADDDICPQIFGKKKRIPGSSANPIVLE